MSLFIKMQNTNQPPAGICSHPRLVLKSSRSSWLIIAVLNVFVFNVSTLKAQLKLRYHAQNYIGLLEGEDKAAFQLQTIHGVQVKSWYAGAGVGLDYYMYRSIPVFFSVNKDITLGNR